MNNERVNQVLVNHENWLKLGSIFHFENNYSKAKSIAQMISLNRNEVFQNLVLLRISQL